MNQLQARPPGFWKHFIGMSLIGIINNVPYWIAISSTQSICVHFGKSGYIGAVTWGCVLFGFAATGGNAFLSSRNVSYVKRAIANGAFMFIGLIGTAFAPNIYLAILTISLIGISSDFGEGVMLGYFAAVDDNSLLRAWGIGTGASGLIGAIYSFLCQYFKINYFYSFICISWMGIAYPLAFYYLIDQRSKKHIEIDDLEQPLNAIDENAHHNPVKADPELPANDNQMADKQGNPIELPDVDSENIKDQSTEDINATHIIKSEKIHDEEEEEKQEEEHVAFCVARLWCKAFPFIINNTLAFFFQYCCLEGLCDCSMTQEQRVNQPYLFCFMSICYQVGQMVSKSTAKFFMTDKLWIFTILNGIVFTFFMINTPFRFTPIWVLDIIMAFLGFFGGLSYMNIFDVIMKLKNSTHKEREIMTNYTSVTISGAIQLASGFILIFQNTFYQEYCKHA